MDEHSEPSSPRAYHAKKNMAKMGEKKLLPPAGRFSNGASRFLPWTKKSLFSFPLERRSMPVGI